MGRVYRARHLALDRAVALKVLRKQHNERWVSRQRFERESRALGQLSHPHVVAVTDSGIDCDVPFLVMELLNGQDLDATIRASALPPALACRYALELLEGLAFVHERGLVHRDIKPANIQSAPHSPSLPFAPCMDLRDAVHVAGGHACRAQQCPDATGGCV